jgi:hypothetical protein
MRPVYHVLSSAGVATVVYGLSGSGLATGLSFLAGVAIDADHLVDYFRARGLCFDWQDFMGPDYFTDAGKIIVPLHSIELLALLWLLLPWLGWSAILGVTASFCLHLLLDLSAYPLHPLTYSFIFRWLHCFDRAVLVLEKEERHV